MNVLGLMTSTALLFVSLWQIEIVSWEKDDNFQFPFFVLTVNKWVARDFWYSVNVAAWVIGIVSAQ